MSPRLKKQILVFIWTIIIIIIYNLGMYLGEFIAKSVWNNKKIQKNVVFSTLKVL